MRIILSPAKKMNVNRDDLEPLNIPVFIKQTEEILLWLRNQPHDELQKIWKCNDKIATQNFERISNMDLYSGLTPAILSYDGIAYKYMATAVFEDSQFDYVEEHLRILSAFYGVLKPMDGVKRIYDAVRDDSGIIINLASKEYSKCLEKYLSKDDIYITVNFCEKSGDRLVTKGTYAKMARGEMVRFMAELSIENPEDIKNFNRLGYVFRDDISTESEYYFEKM